MGEAIDVIALVDAIERGAIDEATFAVIGLILPEAIEQVGRLGRRGMDALQALGRNADEVVEGTARVAGEGEAYLYRGVSADHPEILNAQQGIVKPGNINGTITEEAHNLGGVSADSPFTSWTRDIDIAKRFAGQNGVVLRFPAGAPPAGAAWSWSWSPDLWGESEVLLRGIRAGATVLKP